MTRQLSIESVIGFNTLSPEEQEEFRDLRSIPFIERSSEDRRLILRLKERARYRKRYSVSIEERRTRERPVETLDSFKYLSLKEQSLFKSLRSIPPEKRTNDQTLAILKLVARSFSRKNSKPKRKSLFESKTDPIRGLRYLYPVIKEKKIKLVKISKIKREKWYKQYPIPNCPLCGMPLVRSESQKGAWNCFNLDCHFYDLYQNRKGIIRNWNVSYLGTLEEVEELEQRFPLQKRYQYGKHKYSKAMRDEIEEHSKIWKMPVSEPDDNGYGDELECV